MNKPAGISMAVSLAVVAAGQARSATQELTFTLENAPGLNLVTGTFYGALAGQDQFNITGVKSLEIQINKGGPLIDRSGTYLIYTGSDYTLGVPSTSIYTSISGYYQNFAIVHDDFSTGTASDYALVFGLTANNVDVYNFYGYYDYQQVSYYSSDHSYYGGSHFGPMAGVWTASISAVPEPASWALMMVGVGGMGAALRTRRRKVAA